MLKMLNKMLIFINNNNNVNKMLGVDTFELKDKMCLKIHSIKITTVFFYLSK